MAGIDSNGLACGLFGPAASTATFIEPGVRADGLFLSCNGDGSPREKRLLKLTRLLKDTLPDTFNRLRWLHDSKGTLSVWFDSGMHTRTTDLLLIAAVWHQVFHEPEVVFGRGLSDYAPFRKVPKPKRIDHGDACWPTDYDDEGNPVDF